MSGLGDKFSGPPLYIWPWPSAMQMLKLFHPKGMQQTHIFQIQCPIPYFSVFSFIVTLLEIIVQICFLNFLPYHSPLDRVVSNLFGSRDWFSGRRFFHGFTGGMLWGWFKHIIFIVYFISNLRLLLIWQEVLVHDLEGEDPRSIVYPRTLSYREVKEFT